MTPETKPPDPLGEMLEAMGFTVIDVTPPPTDPLPSLISDLLSMEGMHPETALLIRLAVEAQETGRIPALNLVAKSDL